MGKSFKKNPIIKDNGDSKKSAKKMANRVIRQKLKNPDENSDLANGNAYKKEYNSYNIADFKSRYTKQDAIDYYNKVVPFKEAFYQEEFFKRYPTLEKWLIAWEKDMIRK